MVQDQIKQIVLRHAPDEGLNDTGIDGVQLFRASHPMPCAPAVYEPCIVAIVNGTKEAVIDGSRYEYDKRQYLCCPMSMPVKAGTPGASRGNPLLGVYIALRPSIMNTLGLEIDIAGGIRPTAEAKVAGPAIRLAEWDAGFSDALLRLLQLVDHDTDRAVLADARLKELYYAVLKGQAGQFARQAFAVGNSIARAIAYVSDNLNEPISIDQMATRAGMSRAVFHRKFKEATSLSPIQFVKSMRLNSAAMQIAEGRTISAAAHDVGYVSPSQFTREFRRMYGQSPRQWGNTRHSTVQRI